MTRMTKEQYLDIMMKRKSKFGNTITNGYASKKEFERGKVLCLLVKAGVISELQEQVKFTLLEGFIYKGEKIRGISYIADFVYWKDGIKTIEDVKGFKTEVYKFKKKLLLSKYPDINFIET